MIFLKLFSKYKVVGTSLIQYVYIRFVGRYSHYCCTVGIFVRWQINITVLTKKKKIKKIQIQTHSIYLHIRTTLILIIHGDIL
jgi:hypothetical protein